MNQMQITFVDTRSRCNDPESSRLAAKTAAGGKAGELRRRIIAEIKWNALGSGDGLTAKDLARDLGESFYDVSRRISECAGIKKSGAMRENCMVWVLEC